MRRQRKKRIMVCIWILVLCIGHLIPAAAQEAQNAGASSYGAAVFAPDPDRTGSVSVTLRNLQTKEIIRGGAFALYKAGDIREANGEYFYAYTDAFSGCGYSLENLQSEKLVQALVAFAEENQIEPNAQAVQAEPDTSDAFVFPGLQPGLYLLVQTEAAAGYCAANPFLVTVPGYDGESWVYDVDASPKVSGGEPETEPGTEPETEPETESGTEPGTEPGTAPGPGTAAPNAPEEPGASGGLPQTGQLWWPVPLLAAAGLVLFLFGWLRRRNGYEEK